MDPEMVRRAVEGYQDELGPALRVQEAFYHQKSSCPRCQSSMAKEFDARTAFVPDEPLPRALLRCEQCGLLMNPHTDLIVEAGSPTKVPREL
jgi:ribosomal protein S27AE